MEVMATKRVEVREANPKKAIDTNFSDLKAMSTMEVTLWKNTRFTDETRAKGDELQIKSMAAKRKAKESGRGNRDIRANSQCFKLLSSELRKTPPLCINIFLPSLHTKVEEEEIVKKTIDEGSLPAKAGVTKRHSAAPEIVTEEKTFQNTTKEVKTRQQTISRMPPKTTTLPLSSPFILYGQRALTLSSSVEKLSWFNPEINL
ncbi:hypothetical protein U1Q18_014683 [Sarracenia purpurea var. burkii]